MDDETKFTPEVTYHDLAIRDFLDGRGQESEHPLANELEALFEAMPNIPELKPILAIAEDEAQERRMLVEFMQKDAARLGEGFERTIVWWIQAFVGTWHEETEQPRED